MTSNQASGGLKHEYYHHLHSEQNPLQMTRPKSQLTVGYLSPLKMMLAIHSSKIVLISLATFSAYKLFMFNKKGYNKYNALMKRNSTLFQRVSQKYIASYLGVSEQSLSRIKKQAIS